MIDRQQRLAALAARRRASSPVLHRFAGAPVAALSENEIDVTLCTSSSDALDGDIWVMGGIDLTRFLEHPIVLWNHDMAVPIGRASNLKVSASAITARVTFPDAGISPKADEIRGMVKAGIVTGVSTGILPTEVEPIDRYNPRAGNRVTKSILMEFSIVTVPADASSGVTARGADVGSAPKFGESPAPSERAEALKRARQPIYFEKEAQ